MRPVRILQVVVGVVLFLTFMAMFSSDEGDLVIPQGGKIYTNLRSFIREDDGEKKWDPFGLGLPSENAHQENIVFKSE